TVERSEKELMKLGKLGFETLLKEADNIYKELFELRNEQPNNDKVQQHIARHYETIRKFWGASNLTDKQAVAYVGLGELYVSDDRYLANATDGNPQPEFARFLQKAMKHFAESNLR